MKWENLDIRLLDLIVDSKYFINDGLNYADILQVEKIILAISNEVEKIRSTLPIDDLIKMFVIHTVGTVQYSM